MGKEINKNEKERDFKGLKLDRLVEKEFKTFKEDLDKEVSDSLQNIVVRTLVWGPGKGSKRRDLYKKRLDIRKELLRKKHLALFSEELEQEQEEVNNRLYEFMQAKHCDCIIIIAAEIGSTNELRDIVDFSKIIGKSIIFFPSEANKRYTGDLISDLEERGACRVERFTKKDVTECNLLSNAVKFVDRIHKDKYMKEQLRKELQD